MRKGKPQPVPLVPKGTPPLTPRNKGKRPPMEVSFLLLFILYAIKNLGGVPPRFLSFLILLTCNVGGMEVVVCLVAAETVVPLFIESLNNGGLV